MISKAVMHLVRESEIHNDYWGSDHCPISATIDAENIDLDEFKSYMAIDSKNVTALNEDSKAKKQIEEQSEEAKSDLEDFEEQDREMMDIQMHKMDVNRSDDDQMGGSADEGDKDDQMKQKKSAKETNKYNERSIENT